MENTPNMQMNQNPNDRSAGPVIGLVIILIIIVAGGLYFWSSRETLAPQNGESNIQESTTTPASTETINEQGSSDEINSIEADLNSFNEADINGLDSDL